MKKSYLIAIGIVTIISSLFYAGIWTCESNTLSECFTLSGFVAVGQFLISIMACSTVECFK